MVSTQTPRRILIIQGHPDPAGGHFCHALAARYEAGARAAGHEVQTLQVGALQFPLLRNAEEWSHHAPPRVIRKAQEQLRWAEHVVIVFPLWLGDLPAALKGFFEHAFRPGFAIAEAKPGRLWKKLLAGRSAHVVVTMGMPAFFYRLYYRGHSVKNLKRNILHFCGFSPVRTSLIGTVEQARTRNAWLARLRRYGVLAR